MAIVIGVVVMILLWVAVPAAVVERHGVLASLSRSLELTKGSRWKILVIFLLLGSWVLVVALFFGVILTSELGSAVGAGSNLVILAGFIVTVFYTVLWAVLSAVSYHDLRVVKEGIETKDIAAAFD